MNINLRLTTLLLVLCTAMGAHASTMTLNFNEFDSPDLGAGAGAPVGPISYNNLNHGAYGTYIPSILLGDDGWVNNIVFNANAGFRFDALSLRLLDGFQNVWKSTITGAIDPFDEFAQLDYALSNDTLTKMIYPNVQFKGYRDGATVAMREETYDGGLLNLSFDTSFTDLDGFEVRLDFMGADGYFPEIAGDTLLYCPNQRCGLLEFDDLALNVLPQNAGGAGPTTTPVPLPGTGLMLGMALLGAGAMRRFKMPG